MDADTDTPPEIDENSSEVVDNLYYMHTMLTQLKVQAGLYSV